MKLLRNRNSAGALLASLAILVVSASLVQAEVGRALLLNLNSFLDPTGIITTYNANGIIDPNGPFFQSFGTNGGSCGTCHQPSDAMSVSAAHVELRFDATLGLDPISRTVDGSNCDHNIDVSTLQGRRSAYSLLRTRGLIRVALAPPVGSDFRIVSVSNPYGCSETDTVSVYRRPLPTSNLKFLSTMMWAAANRPPKPEPRQSAPRIIRSRSRQSRPSSGGRDDDPCPGRHAWAHRSAATGDRRFRNGTQLGAIVRFSRRGLNFRWRDGRSTSVEPAGILYRNQRSGRSRSHESGSF